MAWLVNSTKHLWKKYYQHVTYLQKMEEETLPHLFYDVRITLILKTKTLQEKKSTHQLPW